MSTKRDDHLADAARFAPTGHNYQGVSLMVITDADMIRKLSGLVAVFFGGLAVMMEENPGAFDEKLLGFQHGCFQKSRRLFVIEVATSRRFGDDLVDDLQRCAVRALPHADDRRRAGAAYAGQDRRGSTPPRTGSSQTPGPKRPILP